MYCLRTENILFFTKCLTVLKLKLLQYTFNFTFLIKSFKKSIKKFLIKPKIINTKK